MSSQISYNQMKEFSSVKKYLDLSIGSKKGKIDGSMNLEQKLEKVNESQYLRGLKVFLNDYSEMFNNPLDIIEFFKNNRDNDSEMDKLHKEVSDFPNYIVSEMELSESTANAYQSHVRGFLKHNNINMSFKNYKVNTKKRKLINKLGIKYEEMRDFAKKIKNYIKDFDLMLLVEFLHRTGLGYREIADITFGTLRAKDYSDKYVVLSDLREKTQTPYRTFLDPYLQDLVKDYLKQNTDKKDSDKIFGNNTDSAYHSLNRRLNTAYRKTCKNHYPRFLKVKTKKGNMKKLFSLHSFRAIFKTTADNLRVPENHRCLLQAHTSKGMTNYDLPSNELLESYKVINNELFGTKADNTETIDQVFEVLKDLVQNNGKRKALFRKYNEDNSIDIDTELKGAILLEDWKRQIKEEIIIEAKKEAQKEIQKELESAKKDMIKDIKNELLKDLINK